MDRGPKWRRIIAAATELFTVHGFRKTSVNEIAQRAHVAKGTIYLYFRTKAGILLHALVEEKKAYFVRFAPIFDPQLEPAERLRLYLRTILTLATEMPLVSKVLSGDREVLHVLEDELDPDLREQMLEMHHSFVGELIVDAAVGRRPSEADVRDRATVILGLLHSSGFLADERMRFGLSIDRFAEILADMIVDGVAETRALETAAVGEAR